MRKELYIKFKKGKYIFNEIIIFLLFFITSSLYSQYANTNWANLKKKIAIYPSLNESAWLGKGIVTNMVPVGDGTYEIKLNLTPGEYYNYIFFVYTEANSEAGLAPYSTYYDQVPTIGYIPASTTSNTIQFTNIAYYGAVGDNRDARRIIKVPLFLTNAGSKLYVFNNFSEAPKPPEKVEALPGDKKIILNWYPAKGQWNIEDINVKIGGRYSIYYNSTGADANFTFLTDVMGNVTTYTHRGLVNGTTYYYVIVSVDAYQKSPFETKTSDLPVTNGSTTAQAYATPYTTMPVYFKVENIKLNIVKKENYLVWLTPSDKDGRLWWNKYPARMAIATPERKKKRRSIIDEK